MVPYQTLQRKYSIHFYSRCGNLTICTWTRFDHGQILIETATHSLVQFADFRWLLILGMSDNMDNVS